MRQRIVAFLLAVGVAIAPGAVAARTCVVDVERAHAAARAAGWFFMCRNSFGADAAVAFDRFKRIGCAGVAPLPIQPNVRYTARLFCNTADFGEGRFRNGWRLQNYTVRGGRFDKLTSRRCVVQYSFVTPRGRRFARHVNEVRVVKDGARTCDSFYSEAF